MSWWKKVLPWVGAAAAAYLGYSYAPRTGGAGSSGINDSAAAAAAGGYGSSSNEMESQNGAWNNGVWNEPKPYQVAVNGTGGMSSAPWWVQPAVGIGTSLVNGAFNYYGQQQQNTWNAAQAQRQMDFQNEQTSTSWQRGVADMQAAGLNPSMAYGQGGAGSGSGAMATMGNALGAGANSALSSLQTIAGITGVMSGAENQTAQADYTRSNTALQVLRGDEIQSAVQRNMATAGQAKALTQSALAKLKGDLAESDVAEGTVGSRIARAKGEAASSQSEAVLRGLQIPRAKNWADQENTPWKRRLSPYVSDIADLSSAFSHLTRGW